MDKYEFNLKLEQIKKLASKKDYRSAAEIANSLDCRKVKDWSALATIINVQEAAGYYEEARDTAILAYNRNQGGRKLVYKLVELFIRLRQFDDAEDLYEEYVDMAPRDVNRYILEYKLRKAQNSKVGTLISILEKYHAEEDTDEKYTYELAQLYSYAGMSDKCVRLCDDIILMFRDGEYVADAIKLKQQYVSITNTQQLIYEEAVKKNNPNDLEQTKEIMFAKAKEEASRNDEMDGELDNNGDGESEGLTVGKIMQEAFKLQKEDEPQEVLEDAPSLDLIQNKADVKTQNFFKALINHAMDKSKAEQDEEDEDDIEDIRTESPQIEEDDEVEEIQEFKTSESKKPTNDIESAKKSLDALISKARQDLEDNYEFVRRQNREDDIAKTAESIEVPINDSSIYDTRNIQAELAKNLGELMDEDFESDFKPSKNETRDLKKPDVAFEYAATKEEEVEEETVVDEQIRGQMSIAEWIEDVNEKKYGNRATKEFSKAELEHELALRESKEEAYDRLMAKQKEEAKKNGEPFNEAEARLIANQQLVLQSVKTDLAIRTGKATAGLEQASKTKKEDDKIWLYNYKQEKLKEEKADLELAQKEASATLEQEQLAREVKEAMAAEEKERIPAVEEDSYEVDEELEEELDEEHDQSEDEEYEDEEYDEDSEDDEEDDEEEEDEDYDDSEFLSEEDDEPRNVRDLFRFGRKKDKKKEYYDEDEDQDEYEEEEEEEKLEIPRDVRKFFTKYGEMDGVTSQLAEYFATVDSEMGKSTSSTGNIIIGGNRSSDKVGLAKNIARALMQMYPNQLKNIAKTTGQSINERGIVRSLSKLRSTVFIIEDAGSIIPKRVTELLSVMDQDTGGMVVILTDSDTEIGVLLSVNPDITENFNHRITIKQYAVAELVELARKYATKRQYVVNDDALTSLYMKINNMNKEYDYVKTDDVKEIIDVAIVNAEKRASKRLFGRHPRRGGEYFVLTEADFKD